MNARNHDAWQGRARARTMSPSTTAARPRLPRAQVGIARRDINGPTNLAGKSTG